MRITELGPGNFLIHIIIIYDIWHIPHSVSGWYSWGLSTWSPPTCCPSPCSSPTSLPVRTGVHMYIQVTFISLFLATLVHILAAGVDFGFVGPILLFLMWQRQWRCWWCLAKVIHVFPYLCGWMNIHWAALRLHPRLPCWQRGYHQSPTWWPWRSWHWTDEVDDDNDTGNFVDDIKFNDDSLTVIFGMPSYLHIRGAGMM